MTNMLVQVQTHDSTVTCGPYPSELNKQSLDFLEKLFHIRSDHP